MLTLDLAGALALISAMLVLAALPSISVLAVTSRALAGGFRHGAAVSAGVVAGDLLFILIALFGVTLLLNAANGWASWLKFLAAAYLLWMALGLWRSAADSHMATTPSPESSIPSHPVKLSGSLRGSFVSGLLLTLGDQKAVLFYLGFFPAFVDVAAITFWDVLLIMLITIICVGGVKLVYAALVARAGQLLAGDPRFAFWSAWLNRLAALLLVVAAGLVILRY
ncbi:LysE family translocator [Pseudohongiella sp. SYSU M77423]|uniref:LysE family translocator n=1 Tax=Pseudohongiella sp. SYSU M77423 TaxID=3042312 RepID=UPI0024807F7F|nr:LysE family translocator [Pseudohongiella sp. SYSU M77423]MDH7944089.1 LysE family translocator [Pseudohongiella sp. SYSU M77423]